MGDGRRIDPAKDRERSRAVGRSANIAELKMGRKENAAGSQGTGTMVAALVLVALVPAVGVLWFMTVAMRSHLSAQGTLMVKPGVG